MYDTLYGILDNSENATLQYFIFGHKYLLKSLIMFSRHPASDSSQLHQFVSFDVESIPFLCLKLYSLNFAIAHAQKRLLCLSEFVILVLH